MTDWSTYFEEERKRVEKAIRDRLTAGFDDEPISLLRPRASSFSQAQIIPIKVVPAPTHEETVKAVWAEARHHWPAVNMGGRMEVVFSPVGHSIMYEQIRYGGTWVIEADGVIVERIDA